MNWDVFKRPLRPMPPLDDELREFRSRPAIERLRAFGSGETQAAPWSRDTAMRELESAVDELVAEHDRRKPKTKPAWQIETALLGIVDVTANVDAMETTARDLAKAGHIVTIRPTTLMVPTDG